MGRKTNVALLLVALLWTLLITSLIGNIIALNKNGHMVSINFAMFVAALAWIVGFIGLLGAFVSAVGKPAILIPLYGLITLFAFIAAVVLASETRAPNCGNLGDANLPRNWIGYGSHNDAKRCRELEASTAFMWFLWATFGAILLLAIFEAKGPIRRSRGSNRPMSQVA